MTAQRKSVHKEMVCVVFGVLLLALSFSAEAQQPKKVARIGYVGNSPSNSAIDMKPFRERLRELGYVEGQNITIESVYFEGKIERLPELAAQLVRLKCDSHLCGRQRSNQGC